jgi:hypothetical protein
MVVKRNASKSSYFSAQSSELWCYHGVTAVLSGSSSAVERQLPKLDVAGSIPVSRSIYIVLIHSALSDCAGSVDAARRAGTSPARHAAIVRGTIALAKTEMFILVTS